MGVKYGRDGIGYVDKNRAKRKTRGQQVKGRYELCTQFVILVTIVELFARKGKVKERKTLVQGRDSGLFFSWFRGHFFFFTSTLTWRSGARS